MIQSRPEDLRSSRILAAVIMPRSPTSTTRLIPKRDFSLSIWDFSVIGSAVLPSNTSIAIGKPSRVQSKPIDDLRPVAAMIAAVAILRQRTVAALEVGRAHVVEHQHAVLEMPPRQAVLDPRLALQEPIQRLVGLAVLDPAEAQDRAQARGRRLLVHRAHKAQLGARRDQPVDHHRHHEIAIAPRLGILRRAQDQPVQGDLADHPQRRRDMAMRQRALDLQLIQRPGRSAFRP